MSKQMWYRYENMGTLGEKVGYLDLHVGDVLNIKSKTGDYENNLMVVFDNNRHKRYSVLGYSLPELFSHYNIEQVASYKIITQNNIRELSSYDIEIKEVSLPKLTVEQIKEYLGFDFELVREEG